MATRVLRRKKSNLTEYKIAVVGAANVGKTALIVRFLTKRYIGEYDHKPENRYKHEANIDGEPALFEILDTTTKSDELTNAADVIQRADGVLLVFSATDSTSFNYIRRARSEFQVDIPMHLVANKTDLLHLRRVIRDDAEALAKDINAKYSEISAAEQVDAVLDVFNDLCKDVLASKRKSKQSLLERVLNKSRPYTRGKSDSNLLKD